MSRQSLLAAIAVLIGCITALHFIATSFYLYWLFWWYDIILHFLGGAFSALLLLWLRFFSGYFGTPRTPSASEAVFFAFFAALSIGAGWEVFERVLGHTWSVEGYVLDTSLDMLLDTTGAIGALLFFRNRQGSSYAYHV
ncbi:MAG: hypothetical protein A2849_03905 [Candidatus Taylorbacteria bacterium RIFCSPHIGHO2_01_FULL_51_15]|uniref:VanZ-like domain-containing protein n=1 Tax=Candidatus Taylorbacteria bacterium RIFCSPHIGHO2_01_FULL_51_15 TaxID=1802304 RepID=A0A1G2MCA2_9BACT|nr:MAG: hypothetical protein A2849_03905 [Candidatus Taylorbacteria bacterium RIFCSPHIGHO2_01_FULL_51_15]